MDTQCTRAQLEFPGLGRRRVVAAFDGGAISSDGGALLLSQVEQRSAVIRRLGECFVDGRDPQLVEHSVGEMVAQRVLGLALGYEDLNDHDRLRHDPLLATVVGKVDVQGRGRRRERDRGKALAGKSTLNRLELGPASMAQSSVYKKVVADTAAMDALLVELFIETHAKAPARIVLDVDATDDPLHGRQEGRFFHGYYRSYCYLPLYIFCGEHLLCARLRTSDIDGAAGTVEELAPIVTRLRRAWPDVQVVVRGDSGFCRDWMMSWCEDNEVDFVLGLAKNARLKRIIGAEQKTARERFERTGEAQREYRDFHYRTRKSWSRERRVVGKAEHLHKGANPRFVVTSLDAAQWPARELYEDEYCARGDMENRIKEQQLALFADRTSSATMRANQLRLYFSSFAYCLLQALRRIGLAGTAMARAQCDTIRSKLLKIGARVRVSVRRIAVSLSESYPHAALFTDVYRRLRSPPAAA